MSHLTDERLIDRALGGDVETFGDLVRRYQGLVFGVAFYILGDPEAARDVGQNVFVRAFVRLGQLRDPSKFGSWIRQIAVTEARAWANRHPMSLCLEDVRLANDPVSKLDNRLLLTAALNAIDEPSRLTVILFYLHAYSIKEIGEFLDEPGTTIKSRLRNARAKLRRELEEVLETNLNRETLPKDFAERVTRLLEAVKAGDEPGIRSILQADPNLVSANEEPGKNSPLHIAAGSGDAAVVELLLSFGANPNALDGGDNASPLHHAAERGRLEVVKLLLAAGSDINWNLTIHQASPLGWATMFDPNQREVAEYLLSQGAKLDLFSAIALGYKDDVRKFIEENRALLRMRMSGCERFRSAIEYATERKQFEIAELLVQLGSEVGLCEAAGLGMTDLVSRRLLEQPAQWLLNDSLKAAVSAGQTGTARLLLMQGADPDYAPQGTSLLFHSIGGNDAAMSQLLIEFGADLEFQDKQWKATALGWQVFFGKAAETQLAIDLGSKISPNLIELAQSGERGELRRFSPGTPAEYRAVVGILRSSSPSG